MVRVLVSSAVDRGFESRSGHKDHKIGICCFSAKHTALREGAKTGWLRIKIIHLSGVTCLSRDCCYSELKHYKNLTKCVGLVQSGSHHHLIEINLFSP